MRWFKKDKKKGISPKFEPVTRGLLIFFATSEVMEAEQILKEENYDIQVVSPPPQYRKGCDLCLEFPLVEEPGITRLLTNLGLVPIDVVPASPNGLKPLKLCRTKDLGQYVMVRAANMKITVDKTTKRIVNISGGGCPDVPYLAYEMVGKLLSEAPKPISIGSTLCAYSLNIACEEMMRIIGGEYAPFREEVLTTMAGGEDASSCRDHTYQECASFSG